MTNMLDTWWGPEWSRTSYKNVFWNVENISNSQDWMITMLFRLWTLVEHICCPWNVCCCRQGLEMPITHSYSTNGSFTLCLVQYGHGHWTMYTRISVTFWGPLWSWTYVGSYCTKQPNIGCWQHGTFSTFMWAVLILGSADHFPTISFWTINWHSGYFNLGECSHQF